MSKVPKPFYEFKFDNGVYVDHYYSTNPQPYDETWRLEKQIGKQLINKMSQQISKSYGHH